MNKSYYLLEVQSTLARLLPTPNALSNKERCQVALGACCSLLFASWMSYIAGGKLSSVPLLAAPMGASSILIFALPSSPLAQPWAVCLGNSLSAIIGVACAMLFGHHPMIAALAVALAMLAMSMTRSLHPPGGAIALLAVLGGPQIERLSWSFIWTPVALQSVCLVAVAISFHHLRNISYPQLAKAPGNLHRTGDPQISARIGISDADLDAILARQGKLLDISSRDLQNLITSTEIQVHRRRHGSVKCSDIMSRHVISVNFETSLEECWQLLRKHKVKALPVIDDKRKVIGTVSLIDFLKKADLDVYHDFDVRIRHFLDRAQSFTGSEHQVVGHIMNTAVQTKNEDSDVLELVTLFTDLGLHSIPILNAQAQLKGMITQSDLISTLYRLQIDKVIEILED